MLLRHTTSMNTFPDVHGLQLEHISDLFVWGLAGSYTTRSPLKESRRGALLESRAPQ